MACWVTQEEREGEVQRQLLFIITAMLWVLLPHFLGRQYIDVLVFAGIYAISALGVSLLLGYGGMVTLAQSVFYAVGAYTSAYLTTNWSWSVPAGMLFGAILSGTIALVIGWPILKFKGYFLAIATLAVAIIANALFYEFDSLTGGAIGIGGIPKINFFGVVLDSPTHYYYFVWVFLGLCLWLVKNVTESRVGLGVKSMRDSTEAARILGVEVHLLRVQMFVICGVLGSLSGSLFAHYTGYVSVNSFSIEVSILFLLIPVLGGLSSLYGVVIGALFITFTPVILSKFGELHGVIFGIALVLLVTLAPKGIFGVYQSLQSRRRRRSNPATEPVTLA